MTWLTDLRFAFAILRRRPAVPLVTAALLALSVGLAGGLWAVVDAVALRPLPYPDATQLVAVMESHPERGQMSVAAANFWDWTPRVHALRHVVGLGSLEALDRRAEVAAVGAASYVPPGRIFGNVRFSIDDQGEPTDARTTLVSAVDSRAFDLLGLGVQRGRLIEARDGPGAPRVAAISAALARRYWPNADPIGHRVTMAGDDTPHTIVGVVDDARQPLARDPRAESVLYVSYRQVPWPFMTLLIAPAGGPEAAVAALREEAARLDPMQALSAARPVDEIRREWMTQPRLRSFIVIVFGLSAALVTLVGLWARVSWSVSARAREWAIRQAVGASPRLVVSTAVAEAMGIVVGGVGLGVALLPLSAAAVDAIVAGLPGTGVGAVTVAVLLFLAAGATSAYLPARKAGRANPASVLRAE